MKILKGHVSPETAFVVNDYPYGFRLRCKIRYWLEHHPKRGFRFVSQTTNPKRSGEAWNKPKASTYSMFGMAMFLDDNEHVQHSGLTEYSSGLEAAAWSNKFRDGVPEIGLAKLDAWTAAKTAYDTNRSPGDPLHVGLKEARDAFLDVARAEGGQCEPIEANAVCSNCGHVKADKTFQRDRCPKCNESNIWKSA